MWLIQSGFIVKKPIYAHLWPHELNCVTLKVTTLFSYCKQLNFCCLLICFGHIWHCIFTQLHRNIYHAIGVAAKSISVSLSFVHAEFFVVLCFRSRLSPWEQCHGWPLHYRCLPHRSERLAAHWWPGGEDHQSASGGEADCRAHCLPAVLPSCGPAVETILVHTNTHTQMNIQTHVYMQTLSLTLTYTRTHTQPRVYTGTLPNFTIVLFPSTLLFQRASFSNLFFFFLKTFL